MSPSEWTKTYRQPSSISARAYTPKPTDGPTNFEIGILINVGTFGMVFLLFLATLPRAWMRYRHPTAKKPGWRFKQSKTPRGPLGNQGESAPPSPVEQLPQRAFAERNDSSASDSDDPKEKGAEYAFESTPSSPIEPPSPSSSTAPLSRVASWEARFHSIARHLSRPLWFTGYTLGLTLAFAIYTGMITFGTFYHNLPTFSARRAGWVCTAQWPFIFALGMKNNLIGFLLGVGYEKLNVWHRWVGKIIFVAGMAHVSGYLIMFGKRGELVRIANEEIDGWICFAGLCLLCVISIPVVRRMAYTFFWHCHWVGYMMMIVGIHFHAHDRGWHYSVACGAILAFDHICRIYKTTFVTATITAVPELKCTRIEVSHLTRGWRAGQHVRIWAVSTKMGLLRTFEAHPFTIATVSESPSGEGLVLYAKAAGDWTDRLYDIAKTAAPEIEDGEKGVTTGAERGIQMRMVLEGPYGGPGHDVLSTFSSAFVVVGGSGITFGLSTVDEIIREAESGHGKTKLVHLVWVVQDPSSLVHLLLVLQAFLDRVSRLHAVDVTISVYYTRAISQTLSDTLQTGVNLPQNIQLHPGRPKLGHLMRQLVDQTASLDKGSKGLSGMVVGCCGPESLRESVKEAERSISGKKRSSIGGVEVVEEMFGW